MGIGTRVQYTEVPLAAGNVISDGLSTSSCVSSSTLTVAHRTRILRGRQIWHSNRE